MTTNDATLDDNTRRPGRHSVERIPPGFVVTGELGRGGMGVVYRARREKEGDEVALKLLLPGADDDTFQERFVREITAALRIPSPHVVRVLAYGLAPVPWMATEIVNWGSLRELLKREPRLPVPLALRFLDDMLAGLGAAHGEGVVHRDVKPQNLLLAADGRLKVADFGVARVTDESSLTSTGGVVGTPAYMSPEQANGQKADEASDLFAAGIVFFEMLTGEHPFRAESPGATLVRIVGLRHRLCSELNPIVPDEVELLSERLLREKSRRITSTSQARAVLAPLLASFGATREEAAGFLVDAKGAMSADARFRGAQIAEARTQLAAGKGKDAALTTVRLLRAWPLDPDVKNVARDVRRVAPLADHKSPRALELLRRAENEAAPAATLHKAVRVAEEDSDALAARVARRRLAGLPAQDIEDAKSPAPGAFVPVRSAEPSKAFAWLLRAMPFLPSLAQSRSGQNALSFFFVTAAIVFVAMLAMCSRGPSRAEAEQQTQLLDAARGAIASGSCAAASALHEKAGEISQRTAAWRAMRDDVANCRPR